MKKNGLVLYYGLKDGQQEERLVSILADLSLAGRKVEENEVDSLVAQLLEQKNDPPAGMPSPEKKPAASILLMDRLPDEKIKKLLGRIRQEAGLEINLKAVVTKHNLNWTFAELAAEIKREDTFMRQLAALEQMVAQAKKLLDEDPGQVRLAGMLAEAKAQLASARAQKAFDQAAFIKAGRELALFLQEREA